MQKFFNSKNYLALGAGLVLLVIGFFLLGLNPMDNKIALNVAPFVLVLAYAIVFPIAIMLGKNKDEEK